MTSLRTINLAATLGILLLSATAAHAHSSLPPAADPDEITTLGSVFPPAGSHHVPTRESIRWQLGVDRICDSFPWYCAGHRYHSPAIRDHGKRITISYYWGCPDDPYQTPKVKVRELAHTVTIAVIARRIAPPDAPCALVGAYRNTDIHLHAPLGRRKLKHAPLGALAIAASRRSSRS